MLLFITGKNLLGEEINRLIMPTPEPCSHQLRNIVLAQQHSHYLSPTGGVSKTSVFSNRKTVCYEPIAMMMLEVNISC
jgi:hypothetical protein